MKIEDKIINGNIAKYYPKYAFKTFIYNYSYEGYKKLTAPL